nr:MAG TPA: hypothetical protein [Inoviridae sp.]
MFCSASISAYWSGNDESLTCSSLLSSELNLRFFRKLNISQISSIKVSFPSSFDIFVFNSYLSKSCITNVGLQRIETFHCMFNRTFSIIFLINSK